MAKTNTQRHWTQGRDPAAVLYDVTLAEVDSLECLASR